MSAAFLDLIDLASERLGGAVVAANDEFFAPKENLIKAAAPVRIEGKYTDRGKWMDGWETRRRREPGHDWCVIRFGAPGIVRGVDIDTANFTGNYPESCAIDVGVLRPFDPSRASGPPRARSTGDRRAQDERAPWHEVLARAPINGDAHNLFAIDAAPRATHLRLRIFPDGGVARLRAHGEVVADWDHLRRRGDVDLAAAEHGGLVVACSDRFFGSHHNLIMPGDATHMGDGWETKRRRGAGHDWTIVRLAAPGTIRRIEVDTRHFKGNAPGACSFDAASLDEDLVLRQAQNERGAQDERGSQDERGAQDGHWARVSWRELLPRTAVRPHVRHTFEREVSAIGAVTHVRFNIFPDGGVGRLRLYGRPK